MSYAQSKIGSCIVWIAVDGLKGQFFRTHQILVPRFTHAAVDLNHQHCRKTDSGAHGLGIEFERFFKGMSGVRPSRHRPVVECPTTQDAVSRTGVFLVVYL